MNYPLVSVIIPFYKEPLTFAKSSIESILRQSYENLEIIILLDNPDNDELRKIISQYQKKDKRIIFLINECNIGLPMTLNKGIDLASGNYIARMDGDDIAHIDRITTQVTYLQEHANVDLVGSDASIIDQNNNVIGHYRKLKSDYCQKLMLKYAFSDLIHPTWMGKGDLFKKLRYRDFPFVEDFDFLLRTIFYNYTINNIPQELLSYRIVQNKVLGISRLNAFAQYKNSLIAKNLYKLALKKSDYPSIPIIYYDENDINKFNSLNRSINDLRNNLNAHKYINSIKLIIKILRIDHRPITYRLKNQLLKYFLRIID